jgi:long-chain-fatty-acid--[acyl-carrier-protein] ligase
VSAEPAELKPIPAHWFPPHPDPHPIAVPEGETIAEVFWRQARRHPRRLIVADQISGVRSYRDLLTAVLALKPDLQALPGEYVGIMLPASVAAVAAYLAVMFAGKTPVMVNWTVGTRSMIHSLDLLGVGTVLTAERVIQRVQSQVGDLGTLRDRFLLLEDLRGRLSLSRKIAATLRSRFDARALAGVRVTDTAVVLFTSGSESLPKAVPLTHANLLANIRDIALALSVRRDDRLIGMLPPFHSFGLTCTVLLSLCGGIPAAYHANPTEGTTLARLIEAYRCTMLIGTPTFLGGIIRSADDRHLQSLRLVVSGAEKCPAPVYEAVARRWPKVIMLEGYGVTECSPVVSVNDERAPRPQTIGKVLRSFAYTVADAETHRRVEPGRPGVLLLRGPCVFPGYLKHEGASPFVECEGQQWYRTGDLVVEDAEGVLTFAGRLKRFIKLAGEMISLPAIEDVLTAFCGTGEQGEPLVAVECTPQEINPELVLFTPLPLAREEVNRRLRAAGLSPLHNIRVVRRIERIPTLGTGKTDYRALRQLLVGEATSPSARRT